MSSNYIDAEEPSRKETDEYESVEQELHAVPLEKYRDEF